MHPAADHDRAAYTKILRAPGSAPLSLLHSCPGEVRMIPSRGGPAPSIHVFAPRAQPRRGTAHHHRPAPPKTCGSTVGPHRGLAGLRADAPSEARGADGERAGRPRGGRRSVGATSTPHTPSRHNKTARPQWGRAAVAVALGFEPRVAVTPHSISSAAPSAARTRYLTRILYYRNPRATQIDPPWEQRHTQREPRSRRS